MNKFDEVAVAEVFELVTGETGSPHSPEHHRDSHFGKPHFQYSDDLLGSLPVDGLSHHKT